MAAFWGWIFPFSGRVFVGLSGRHRMNPRRQRMNPSRQRMNPSRQRMNIGTEAGGSFFLPQRRCRDLLGRDLVGRCGVGFQIA